MKLPTDIPGRPLLREFKAFVLRGNVVDLAVGIVIGAAFGRVVDALVKGVFTPIVSLPGGDSLDRLQVCLSSTDGECTNAIRWGAFLDELLSFIILAAVIFFFVVKPVNHLMAKFRSEQPKVDATRECPECLSKIPSRARRCAFCTAEVGPAT